jgi:hypothetical protein
MEGDARQLFFLKLVLLSFSESTGLKVYYNKSMMVTINMIEEKLDHLANTFGYAKRGPSLHILGFAIQIN